jgi:sec-independent protein translocase protein TatC
MSELEEQRGGAMTFLSHLEELRWRLVKAVIAILIFAIVAFIFIEDISNNVFLSMLEDDHFTYEFYRKYFHMFIGMEINANTQSTAPTAQFSLAMYMAFVSGLIVAFPYVISQIWGFLKPGLKKQEISAVKGVTFYSWVLFMLGIAFGYLILSPLCVQFFSNFSISDEVENIFKINDFINLILTTTLYSGIIFELPIVIYFLSKLGIVTPELLRKYRKHALIIVLILSAIITPPDFWSQIIVAVPIMILYEIGIKICARVIKNDFKR